MLFRQAVLNGIANGTITLAFRRWRKPAVKPGGRQRTSIGVIGFTAVDRIAENDIAERDAQAAGYPDRASLLAELDRRQGEIFRVALSHIGDDPRIALRDNIDLDTATLAWLQRLGWAMPVLRLIAERPGTAAADLAGAVGQERAAFKTRVRRLKDRGLTESLKTGYRLSPRGFAALRRVARR